LGFYKGRVALTYNFLPFGDFLPKKNSHFGVVETKFSQGLQ
jgi:hypothetical protein